MRDLISDMNPDAILWDGCDEALIGVTPHGHAVYSIERLWDVFADQGMKYEDAIEWVDYNILGAYVGEYTPMHVYTEKL